MKQHKPHKKEIKPRRKDIVEEKFHHGRVNRDKVKYKHKNHWLEEEEVEIVNIKKKKKPKE